MIRRALSILPVAAFAALGCHDAAGDVTDAPRLLAVNGATFPVLSPGDTAVLEGSGFGVQGNGTVRFASAPATVIAWSDNQIVVAVPDGAASGAIIVVPDTGATLGPVPTLVRPAGGFSPGSFAWTGGPALPSGLRAVQAAALTYPTDSGLSARLHLTGGTTSDDVVQLTSLFSPAGSGGPSAWVAGAASDPAALLYAGAAAATQRTARLRRHSNRDSTVEGVSYLIGGMDAAGRVVADVYGMSVWENGDEGAWTRLVALPDPRAATATVAAYGNIYVIGGFGPDSLALRSTSIAVVDSFGAPAGWISGPPLPEGRAFEAALIHNHTLYVIGGETGHVTPAAPDSAGLRADVFAIPLSVRTGFFAGAGWQTLSAPLSAPRTRHAAFDVDAGILVSIGVTPAGAPESEFAAFATDGTLGVFSALTAPTIASLGDGSISEAGAASYVDRSGVPHVVIVGGVTASGGHSSRVWWH